MTGDPRARDRRAGGRGDAGWSGSVSRTVDEPDGAVARTAWPVAGVAALAGAGGRGGGCVRDLLECVQLAVVVLHRVDVVVRTSAQENGREYDHDDHDSDDQPTSTVSYSTGSAPRKDRGLRVMRRAFSRPGGARRRGGDHAGRRAVSWQHPAAAGGPRGCRLAGDCSGHGRTGRGRPHPSRRRPPDRPRPARARRRRRSSCRPGRSAGGRCGRRSRGPPHGGM